MPAFRDVSINVAAQLKTIGLDATVDVRDAGSFYTIENKGDFQLVAHSVALSGSLPDQILGEGYTSFGGRNYGGWKDDAIDNLFREQSRELDAEKRKELIKQVPARVPEVLLPDQPRLGRLRRGALELGEGLEGAARSLRQHADGQGLAGRLRLPPSVTTCSAISCSV